MSNIDLGNPQVLANLIEAKIKEGNGEYFTKENVACYRDTDGNEYIVPTHLAEKVKVKQAKKAEKKQTKKSK
jgi:ribosomal protein S24E